MVGEQRAQGSAGGPSRAPALGDVWFREPRHGARRRSLSRARIVEAAVRCLDAEGAERTSLRRIADELGVHVTSLYWHVATKDDVLDLALDHVFGEIPPGDDPPSQDWRATVLGFMAELRRMLLRHSWAGGLAVSRPLAGPNALAASEVVYAALGAAGLTGEALAAAGAAVTNLVVATASSQAAWAVRAEEETRQALRVRIVRDEDRYPAQAALLAGPLGSWDSQFEIAARALVEGLSGLTG